MLIYSNIIFGIPNILGEFYYIIFFKFILFLLLHVVCACVYICVWVFEGKNLLKKPYYV